MLRIIFIIVTAQCDFSKMLNERSLYSRFVNVESVDLSIDFEYRYLLHNRPGFGVYLDMNCNRSAQLMTNVSIGYRRAE